MKTIIARILGIFAYLCFSSVLYAAPTANGDAVSQAYAISNSLKMQEKIPGISLIGGQITHSQTLISGRLPYVMSYVGSVRNSLSASNDYFDQFLTTGGWTDNYQNSVRFYSYNGISTTIGYYAIRLPGSRQDVWLSNTSRSSCSGGVHRAFSSDVLGNLAYSTSANLVWACSTNGYQFSENSGGGITITYRGVSYTTTSASVTQSGTTYYRIAKVQHPNGEQLTLNYDSGLNLLSVADGRNNKLTFSRDYKAGTTQTTAEKRLVSKVELTSGSGTKQNATFTYGSYNSQDGNGHMGSIYYPLTATSPLNGKTSFDYTAIKQWGINGYLSSQGKAISNTNAAILTSLKDANDVLRRQWLVTQNYSSYDASTKTYGIAKVTLQVRSPIGSGYAEDYTVNYDDNARTVIVTTKPDGQTTGTVTYTVTPKPVYKTADTGQGYWDDGESEITVSGSFPALMLDGKIPKSLNMQSWYDYIKKAVFSSNLEITQTLDASARLSNVTYLVGGQLIKSMNYTYGALSNSAVNPYLVPTKVTTPYLTINNTINSKGQITKQTQSSSQTDSTSKTIDYTYHSNGLIHTVNGSLSGDIDKVTYTYDSYGNLASQSQYINGATRTTQYVDYNNFAQPERIVYANGMVEQFIYNTDGTLKQKNYGAGGVTGTISGQTTAYTYNTLKQKISETSPDGEISAFAYDNIGRLIQTTLANGNRIKKTYFPIGIVASEKHISAANILDAENYQYLDANGRVAKVRQGNEANRAYILYSYDSNGNLIQTTSATGIIEKWSYDSFDRLISHTDGLGNVNTQGYDQQDNVILAKDALNAGTNPYSYRNGSTLTQEVNSDYGTKTYGYNEADQLTQRLHGTRKCNYNNLDEIGRYRVFACTASSGTTANEYQINDNYLYDQSRYGRLDKVSTGLTGYDVDTVYSYDTYDRVTQKNTVNQLFNRYAAKSGQTLNVSYGYSLGGKPSSMTLPSGRNITYSYTATGMLSSINLNGSALIRNITHDGANRITAWWWGASGGARYIRSYYYNNIGTIDAILNYNQAETTNYVLTHSYDADGRVTAISRNTGTIDNYVYDAANRLKSESRHTNGVATYNISYGYDKNGNRTSLSATGQHLQPAANASYTYSGNKLASFSKNNVTQSISHTANAELNYGTYLPTYDNEGRRKVDRLNTNNYYDMNYNHKNERSYRGYVVSGAVSTMTQYIYDEDSHLIGEYNKNGVQVEYVWLGDIPVAAIYGSGANTKIYYIVTDAQNTPRRLIDSVNHAVVWSWDSTAFGLGNPVGTVTFNLRFPGQYYDELTKQHYNHHRYYNPELGRYMEPDPIGLEGGLNPYAYAGSNPVSNVDPSGLDFSMLNDQALRNARMNDYPAFSDSTYQFMMGLANGMSFGLGQPISDIVHGYQTANVNSISYNVGQMTSLLTGGGSAAARGVSYGMAQTQAFVKSTQFSIPTIQSTFINPFNVNFSQSSIKNTFSAGGSIDDLAMGLRNGNVKVDQIPPIRLIDKNGTLFTLDNRRLEAFRRAEMYIPYRMANSKEISSEIWKFTTTNGGTSIRVRGK